MGKAVTNTTGSKGASPKTNNRKMQIFVKKKRSRMVYGSVGRQTKIDFQDVVMTRDDVIAGITPGPAPLSGKTKPPMQKKLIEDYIINFRESARVYFEDYFDARAYCFDQGTIIEMHQNEHFVPVPTIESKQTFKDACDALDLDILDFLPDNQRNFEISGTTLLYDEGKIFIVKDNAATSYDKVAVAKDIKKIVADFESISA